MDFLCPPPSETISGAFFCDSISFPTNGLQGIFCGSFGGLFFGYFCPICACEASSGAGVPSPLGFGSLSNPVDVLAVRLCTDRTSASPYETPLRIPSLPLSKTQMQRWHSPWNHWRDTILKQYYFCCEEKITKLQWGSKITSIICLTIQENIFLQKFDDLSLCPSNTKNII